MGDDGVVLCGYVECGFGKVDASVDGDANLSLDAGQPLYLRHVSLPSLSGVRGGDAGRIEDAVENKVVLL